MTTAEIEPLRGAEPSRDPRTGATSPGPQATSPEQFRALVSAAAAARTAVAQAAPSVRARWLEAVAGTVDAHTEELVRLADAETALGPDRLHGELAKATAQARFYGSVAVEGGWLGARVDHGVPPAFTRLGRVNLPVGPVAVFGASNFPFTFGVAGHDTCSALAAGCPVLAKAHPAHPRLSVRLGELVVSALREAGAPEGAFGLVVGFDSGTALVDAPEVCAVAFTGSQTGGMALVERARRRARPIPVFAEMGTVNPAVVTPSAVRRGLLPEVARGFVGSFTLGQGQYCTKPGLLLAPRGSEGATAVAEALAEALADAATGWLLTEGIAAAYRSRVEEWAAAGAVPVGQGSTADAGFAAAAMVFSAQTRHVVAGSPLLEECFGPVALVVEYADADDLSAVLQRLQPSLAGAVATGGPDDPDLPRLVSQLSGQVGRIVVDAWPTGVATTWAQHHGGPWPATSRPDATSVGAGALDRFTRPAAFQDVPDAALPSALREDNPWRVPRRVDGILQPVPPVPGGPR